MRRFITLLLSLAVVSGTLFAQNTLPVQYGPWVTAASENSFTVLWMTDTPGLAWVELEDGSRIYQEFAGRRIFERLHKVEVTGLAKGTEYTYRVGGAPLADDSNPYEPKFRDELLSGPFTSRTYDNSAEKCNFSVVNDMHLHLSRFSRLVSGIDAKATDFIFLNGDITSAGNYCLDTLVRYNIEPLKGYAESIPVWFARGNHEVRGNAPRLIAEVFPTPTGKFYYSFRQGPVAFIVMDAAETSRKRSIAFSGSEYFGNYMAEQKEWLKKVTATPEYAEAPVKICILHVPMADIGPDYDIQFWLNKNVLPAVNEAGVDLMVSGDLHEFFFFETGTTGNDFPIIVNDDESRLDIRCDANGYSLSVRNDEGKETFSYYKKLGTRKKLRQNKALIAGTDYVAPTGPLQLTPAPEGYKPCYVSHYARHGARYAWRLENYDMIKRALDDAASKDNLTEFGKDYKARFDKLYPDVKDHYGELSRKGWDQQQAIAAHLYEAVPEAFPDGAKVRAVSSPSLRSVMTMSSYCLSLKAKNPTLFVTEDVSRTNMPATLPLEEENPFYEGYEPSSLPFKISDQQYAEGFFDSEKVLSRLFKKPAKSVKRSKFYELATHMFFFAEGMNSLDTDLDFMDLYTDEEAVSLWRIDNYQLYTEAWPKHNGYRTIIRDIIDRADAHIAAGEGGADLRFAHDYTFMSLMMCLDLEGFGKVPQTPEEVEEVFQSYKIPMGANMHFIFYRSDDSDEILFKVLLNGEEGHLPLPADRWPYYRWSDFKAAHRK